MGPLANEKSFAARIGATALALSLVASFVACIIQPQPIPPDGRPDTKATADAAAPGPRPTPPPPPQSSDAGASGMVDGGADAPDAGDGGDGGDGAPDDAGINDAGAG